MALLTEERAMLNTIFEAAKEYVGDQGETLADDVDFQSLQTAVKDCSGDDSALVDLADEVQEYRDIVLGDTTPNFEKLKLAFGVYEDFLNP